MRVAAKIEAGMIALSQAERHWTRGGQGQGIAAFMEAKYLAVAM
jgi:hypothetical protein